MEQIRSLLEARRNYLTQLIEEKERALKKVPPGSLRVCSHGNRTQFYHRTDPKDFNGVYLREEDGFFCKENFSKNSKKTLQKVLTSVLGSAIVQICQANLAKNEKYTLQAKMKNK